MALKNPRASEEEVANRRDCKQFEHHEALLNENLGPAQEFLTEMTEVTEVVLKRPFTELPSGGTITWKACGISM